MIHFKCPTCQATVTVNDNEAGWTVHCGQCRQIMLAPNPTGQPIAIQPQGNVCIAVPGISPQPERQGRRRKRGSGRKIIRPDLGGYGWIIEDADD